MEAPEVNTFGAFSFLFFWHILLPNNNYFMQKKAIIIAVKGTIGIILGSFFKITGSFEHADHLIAAGFILVGISVLGLFLKKLSESVQARKQSSN